MGLRVIEVPGATGYFDTDYEAKARFALKALEDTDFVFIHAEAPDEAGHEGLAAEKVKALENFDARLVAPVLEGLGKYGDYRIIVSPDHETPLEKRTHTRGPVPFVLYETGGESDGMAAYSEREASSNGSMRVTQGHDLIHMLLKKS
jgi:2,3-bisphosphoglycerate-independent phosphoglycerate mutase